MVLAVHPSHRFAGSESRWSPRARRRDFCRLSTATCRSAGPSIAAFAITMSTSRSCLSSTTSRTSSGPSRSPRGVAILPEPSLAREVRAGSLVAVRIGGQDPKYRLNRPLAIIHRRNDNLDLTASRFLELLTGSESPAPITDPLQSSRRVPVVSS